MRNIFSLPLAVLLATAGITAAQTADPEGQFVPPGPISSQGPTAPPSEPLPLAPAEGQPAPGSGQMLDLEQPCSKGHFCNKLWVDAEYLMWWVKGSPLPPLLTAGSVSDTVPGALGQPGTGVVFGGDTATGMQSGVRVRGGYWFGDDHIFGADDSFFYLFPNTSTSTFSSDGKSLLAVPYTDVLTGQPAASVLGIPGGTTAVFTASLKDTVYGGDTNLRLAVCRTCDIQLSLVAGLRYLRLNETLGITTDVTPAGVSSGQGVNVVGNSIFGTTNDYYGGQLGADFCWCRGNFSLNLMGKVALGWTHESGTIDGSTQVNVPGLSALTYPTATLVAPSNIGNYSRNVFAVLPEGVLTLGYQLTKHIRLTAGYTFLYTSHVLRAGNLIDTGVNPSVVGNALLGTPVTGPSRPSFPATDSSFWVQGATAGLEFRY